MHERDSSDEMLMRALKREHTNALRLLMERWESRLLQFIYRYVQDESVARDLVQEVFVRLYQARDRFDETRRFSTWMFGIAANLCRNHQRWISRHAVTSLENTLEPQGEGDPASEADVQEAIREVKEAIRQLPHAHRTVVLLYYYENLSYVEIAEALKCSVRGVESRLYRARRILAKRLGLKLGCGFKECRDGHNRIRNAASHVLCR